MKRANDQVKFLAQASDHSTVAMLNGNCKKCTQYQQTIAHLQQVLHYQQEQLQSYKKAAGEDDGANAKPLNAHPLDVDET